MYRLLLLFCLITAAQPAQSQMAFSDSVLQLQVPDTTKLRMLSRWIKMNGPNLREPVMQAAQAALELAKKQGEITFLSDAWFDLGNAFIFQERLDESGAAFNESLRLARQTGDVDRIVKSLRGVIRFYGSKGDYLRTLGYIQETERLIPQVKDKRLIGGCYILYCNIFEQMRRYEDAGKMARSAIDFNLKNQLTGQIPASYYHLGKYFEVNGLADSALYYIQLAREGYRTQNNQEEMAGMTMQIAKLLGVLHRSEEAVREMEAAIDIVEQNRDTAGIGFVNMEKGRLMMSLSRMDEAESALLISASVFEKFGMVPPYQDICLSLSEFYAATGDFRQAYGFFRKFSDIRDSLEGIDRQKQLDELSATFENTKKEQQISLLNQENNNQRLQIGLLIALAAFLIAGSFAGFQYVRNRQRKILLNEQKQWTKIVVDSTENERRRIAADLHDGIAQQIAAVKMYAGGLSRSLEGAPRAQAEKLTAALDNAGREVRQLAHQMMPRSLGELGLAPALEDLFWLTFSQTAVPYMVDTSGYTLPPNATTDTALYRIAQEAVNNIIKHAAAKQVSLVLRNTDSRIFMEITDDGKGFDLKSTGMASMGMENIQSRVRLCGGSANIITAPSEGVKITVEMPFSV